MNRHSHKFSGLTNSTGISMHPTKEGSIIITKIKKDISPNQVRLRPSCLALLWGCTGQGH
jgi:large subunit ribosomal protein L28e